MKKPLFLCVLLLTAVPACAPSTRLEGLVPASGIVLYDGRPVDGATVNFSAETPGNRSAITTADTKGRFSMTTLNPGDGVAPGVYTVTIEKVEVSGDVSIGEKAGRKVSIDNRKYADLLPLKYKNRDTTDLKITIPKKGDKAIEFSLTGKVDATPKKPTGPPRR